MPKGRIKVQCFVRNSYVPVDNSRITVNTQGGGSQVYDVVTDSSGLTPEIEVDAPPVEYSQNPSAQMPYSLCDVKVERSGFDPLNIRGCQIFPERTAIQPANLNENTNRATRQQIIIIQANTLFGVFPPKIPESPEKPLPPPSSGVVLSQPVVPEFVIVHQGTPDSEGPNYTVRFTDYIKNVASCEIYSTWSESTIRANVYCILSFTLNRIFTEWYRGKGKSFDITNSTAFDHAFNYGRNIYENISRVVDEIFTSFVKRSGSKQPLLTQYCDGQRVKCPQWLSQWGSKYMGDQGTPPYEILTNYYGSDIELSTAPQVKGIPKSYPGTTLTIGSTGQPVRDIQTYLNAISKNYPAIPKLNVDGKYGPKVAEAVKVFQGVFSLPQTGVVDYATWYKISDVYVGVTKIAELRASIDGEEKIFVPPIGYNFANTEMPRVSYYDNML
ncbi:peptidoglycan-binding domain-containing protein [Clostridium paridis]|uniref:Peptidoglycan-binding protein n=1 Tax=Clostridium paridis TaxID=2803863 RepID=A0A937FH98_9CLOT|nr:peptidoglycan-binding domain-containing protein [Clostridium paridis]MBL4931401.1 peptidoglycan-binding protein [Clostridium paridis]